LVIGVGVKLVGIGSDATYGLGSGNSSFPAFRAQVGNNSSKKIEEFIGMLFLDVG
jgi:hypothetical protein